MLLAVLFLNLFLNVQPQVLFMGKCPEVEVMQNFDVFQYLGKWYEIERYFALFEFGGKCVSADYILKTNGEIEMINEQTSALTGIHSTIEGLGNAISRSSDGKLLIRFPSLPVNFAAPYWVLDTDYENYSVVWSCINFGMFSTKNAWVLSRTRWPSFEDMDRAYKVLDENGINRSYFIKTDQNSCPLN